MADSLSAGGTRIRLRVAGVDDAAVLAALCIEHAAFERAAAPPVDLAVRLALLLRSSDWCAWLAEDDSAAVGFCCGEVQTSAWRGARFWHLDCLYLRPTWRGQGIGLALLDASLAHARALGLGWAEWQTPAWNAAAIGFYRALGASAAPKQRFALGLR
jgi:GNAT superfamily N-acetyltransferase